VNMDDEGADERDHAGEMSTERRRRVKGTWIEHWGRRKRFQHPRECIVPLARTRHLVSESCTTCWHGRDRPTYC
jgi:hypothetical protein